MENFDKIYKRTCHFDKETDLLLEAQAIDGGYVFSSNPTKMNVSKYMRALVHAQERPLLDQAFLEELKTEYANLSRIGSNLNQLNYYLGRKIHTGEDGFQAQLGEVEKDTKVIFEELHKMLCNVTKVQDKLAQKLQVD